MLANFFEFNLFCFLVRLVGLVEVEVEIKVEIEVVFVATVDEVIVSMVFVEFSVVSISQYSPIKPLLQIQPFSGSQYPY